jgi:hypothetical protein
MTGKANFLTVPNCVMTGGAKQLCVMPGGLG